MLVVRKYEQCRPSGNFIIHRRSSPICILSYIPGAWEWGSYYNLLYPTEISPHLWLPITEPLCPEIIISCPYLLRKTQVNRQVPSYTLSKGEGTHIESSHKNRSVSLDIGIRISLTANTAAGSIFLRQLASFHNSLEYGTCSWCCLSKCNYLSYLWGFYLHPITTGFPVIAFH